MCDHNGPFLSAAAIRRILHLHRFSESNRIYLLEEAERRDAWEKQVASLLQGLLTHTSDPSPSIPPPVGRVAETDVTHSYT